jgi:GH18 family chitinase
MDSRYLLAAKYPNKFAHSVLTYLEKYNLDGYDIDWETGHINEYVDELVNILKACKNLFGNKYKLTHTVWPGIHSDVTVGKVIPYLDYINIMSYGNFGLALEPLITNYNKVGVPYAKIILGVTSELDFDNNKTIAAKIDVIKKYDLGGIFLWRIDTDYFGINNTKTPSFKMSLSIKELF